MGYEQLKALIEQSRKEAEEAELQEVTQCPECDYTPLKVKNSGAKLCPICGWHSEI